MGQLSEKVQKLHEYIKNTKAAFAQYEDMSGTSIKDYPDIIHKIVNRSNVNGVMIAQRQGNFETFDVCIDFIEFESAQIYKVPYLDLDNDISIHSCDIYKDIYIETQIDKISKVESIVEL